MANRDVGSLIRRRRKEEQMTLSDLAEKTDLSIGYLSQLERGLTSIAPDTLARVCEALELDIRELSEDETKKADASPVLRSYDREVVSIEGETIIRHQLSSLSDDFDMHPRYVTLLPMKEQEEIECYPHQGEEFVFVLEGILTLLIRGEAYELYPGDSAQYRSSIPHNWTNCTNRQVVFVAVNLPKCSADGEA